MTENLIRNGDFEADWEEEKSHHCLVLPLDAEPYETDIGNIFTPPGWVTWFVHAAGTWDQPEVCDAWKHVDPHRVHSGEKATLLFTFWRRQQAGFYQQVQATPGDRLSLSAYTHAWSNTNIPLHSDCTDKPRCSAGVGTQAVAIPLTDAPPLTGDPWQDALHNFAFTIGIDPTGGTNPLADTVQWGAPYHIYNDFHRLTAQAVAEADTITVFLRSLTLWKFKHNDAYWDSVRLESHPDERGKPRVQYERTYVLLPPAAGQEWARAVVDGTWDSQRYTLGGSADDAGIGDLDYRRVIAVNPAGWGDGLEGFFEDFYPGVQYRPIHAATPDILRQMLSGDEPDIALCQKDPRWADKDLGEDPGGETIGEAGCLVTAYAMCLRHAGHWIYPDELNAVLAEAGTPFTSDDLLTDWPAAVDLFPVFDQSHKSNDYLPAAELETLLTKGWEVILRRADAKHFVYLEKVDGDELHIIDPWDGQRKVKSPDHYLGIRAAHRTDATPPPPPPPPPPTAPLISLHLQSLVEGALDFVERVKPSVVKIFQLEVAKEIYARSPDTIVVLRYFTGDQHLTGDLHAAARKYVQSFEPSLITNHEWINAVESWNEMIATHDIDGIKRAVEFDYWFAEELNALALPDVHPMLLNVAVGNPYHQAFRRLFKHHRAFRRLFKLPPRLGPPPSSKSLATFQPPALLAASEIELMLPAVEQVIKYDGYLGYHAYGQAVAPNGNLNDNWEYFAGRALVNWDPVFRAHGLFPKYIFGECGAFSTCNDGWRSASCLNGDWPTYLAQLTQFSDRIKAWNAQHDNRCLGGTIFTTGGWDWDTFEITKTEMEDPNWPT